MFTFDKRIDAKRYAATYVSVAIAILIAVCVVPVSQGSPAEPNVDSYAADSNAAAPRQAASQQPISQQADSRATDPHELCREATVRVRNGSAVGTGTVFSQTDDAFYVLTNAHVAGTRLGNTVRLEFWRHGHQSRPVAAETVAVAYIPGAYRDIAVLRVMRQTLGRYQPPVIPLAAVEDQASYERIYSVGCPSGRWPTAFEGFATRRQSQAGDTIHFVPMPAGGRSGSAIFDTGGDHPRIIGLIAWRSSDDGGHGLDGRGESHGHGIAMTHQEVWAGLSGHQTTNSVLLVSPPNAIPLAAPQPTDTTTNPKANTATKTASSTEPKASTTSHFQPSTQNPSAANQAAHGVELIRERRERNHVVLKYSDIDAVRPTTIPEPLVNRSSMTNSPVTTGRSNDVMLLYSDDLYGDDLYGDDLYGDDSFGDRSHNDWTMASPGNPFIATHCPCCGDRLNASGSCPGGRCPTPRSGPPGYPPNRRDWLDRPQTPDEMQKPDGIFPSLPRLRNERDDRDDGQDRLFDQWRDRSFKQWFDDSRPRLMQWRPLERLFNFVARWAILLIIGYLLWRLVRNRLADWLRKLLQSSIDDN